MFPGLVELRIPEKWNCFWRFRFLIMINIQWRNQGANGASAPLASHLENLTQISSV